MVVQEFPLLLRSVRPEVILVEKGLLDDPEASGCGNAEGVGQRLYGEVWNDGGLPTVRDFTLGLFSAAPPAPHARASTFAYPLYVR